MCWRGRLGSTRQWQMYGCVGKAMALLVVIKRKWQTFGCVGCEIDGSRSLIFG